MTAAAVDDSHPCEWCNDPTESKARLCKRCRLVQADQERTFDQPDGSYGWLDRHAGLS